MRHALLALALTTMPLAAQDGPFAADAGYFHAALLPAELACPTNGFLLTGEGQLLERGIGATGVSTDGGYLCSWAGTTHAECVPGDIEEGVLVVPAPSGGGQVKRLTFLPDGTLALTRPDGGGRPSLLNRCPETFEAMMPWATAEAFAAAPPPFRRREASESPWAGVPASSLPVTGVFALFPRTAQSEALLNMIANIPPEQLAEMAAAQGLSAEDARPEAMVAAMETETCRTTPYVMSQAGELIQLRLRGEPAKGRIDALSTCTLADKALTCTRATKSGDTFLPGSQTVTWLWEMPETGGPILCDAARGRDDPNACAQMIACPASTGAVPLNTGGTLADLVAGWSGR